MHVAAQMTDSDNMLGLIAGEGALPHHVIAACRDKNRPVFVLALQDITPQALIEGEINRIANNYVKYSGWFKDHGHQ